MDNIYFLLVRTPGTIVLEVIGGEGVLFIISLKPLFDKSVLYPHNISRT
jgi:hypothetical protein